MNNIILRNLRSLHACNDVHSVTQHNYKLRNTKGVQVAALHYT